MCFSCHGEISGSCLSLIIAFGTSNDQPGMKLSPDISKHVNGTIMSFKIGYLFIVIMNLE